MAQKPSTVIHVDAAKMRHAVDAAQFNPTTRPRAHNPERTVTMQHDNNPSRAHIYPPLDSPHTRDTYYDWVMICFAWVAGFITCYLWLTN
jgi:hypothetical protein